MIFGCCKSKGRVSAALYGFVNEKESSDSSNLNTDIIPYQSDVWC